MTDRCPPSLLPSAAHALPCPSMPLPSHMGEYELLERVGRGASAEVWLARRTLMQGGVKPCALKIIHQHIAAHPRHRRMFLQEGRLALKMSHGNVVSVFDVGEQTGRLYMALEWIDGVSLHGFSEQVLAREGNLSIGEVCYVLSQILQGLRHAHGLRSQGRPLGVIHRDIAPHNVLVSESGEVKLSDFGIARVCGELSSGEHIKGRTRYMAPEQLCGEPCQASDLYAVGAVLHELLEGRRFREGMESGPWQRIVSEAPIAPLQRQHVPAPLEALRVGLLQPDPRYRIATADEALRRLHHCPPWTAGADALRGRYERCVRLPRRTGLTRPLQTIAQPLAEPESATDRPRPRPRQATIPARRADETPTIGRDPTARPTRPTRTSRATSARARRRSRPMLSRGQHRGLWGLCGLLGLAVVGVASALPTPPPPTCIVEPEVAPDRWARLRVRGDDQPHAQVRIDMQVVDSARRQECRLSPGVHDLAWRSSPQVPWSDAGPRPVAAAKEHLVRLSEDGLAITAYDP